MNIIINEKDNFVVSGLCAALQIDEKDIVLTNNVMKTFFQMRLNDEIVLITELLHCDEGIEASINELIRLDRNYVNLKIMGLTSITDVSILGLVRRLIPGNILVQKTEPVSAIRTAFKNAISQHYNYNQQGWKYQALESSVHLTFRELGMMKFFYSGLTLTAIGERLCLSPKTVSHYQCSVYRKLKCSSKAEFVSKLRSLGFPEIQ